MKIAVITGESRGFGESIAKLFLKSGVHVIGISRSGNKDLKKYAKETNTLYRHYTCDMANTMHIEETFHKIVAEEIVKHNPATIYLVNNAGVIEPVNQSMKISHEDLSYQVQINTIAPMVLTNAFLSKATELDITLIGVNVTSGAAIRPVYGWSVYCSTKASINMYTKTVALEQDELKTGNKVIAFSPGIMDTAMQDKIRESTYEAFIEIDTFQDYKDSNLLKDTDTVAGVLLDILKDEDGIENGNIYYLRDYM